MKYTELRRKMAKRPAFRLEDLRPGGNSLAHELVQLSQWVKENRLLRLRRGLYAFPEEERNAKLSSLWLAGQLYFPSYISLEFALSQYGLIPEAIARVTSVTTLKTKMFQNAVGIFDYKKVMPYYFFGFKTRKTPEGLSFWMADPEKAILDFIYLSIPKSTPIHEDLLIHSYRLQNLEQLQQKQLKNYISRFNNQRVQAAGKILLKLLKG